jgi:hypothetical protein
MVKSQIIVSIFVVLVVAGTSAFSASFGTSVKQYLGTKPEWYLEYFNWKHYSNAAKGIG